MSASPRCADLSELAGERLGATATTAESWLLVEVPGTWERDVAEGAGLPGPARDVVRAWLESTPASRLLFVRRPGGGRTAARLAFVVHSSEADRSVRRFELSSLDELAEVDLAQGGGPAAGPLVLVCAHGSRDACCALRGTPVHAALCEHLGGDELWLSSHQGGHRFAANVLVLPAALQLGRLTAETAVPVVSKALDGEIDLDHYRGRSTYPAMAQAAELAIRQAHGLTAVADLQLLDVRGDTVRLRGPDGRVHEAVVAEGEGPEVPPSCGAAPERQRPLIALVV